MERLRNGGGKVLVFWVSLGVENGRDWMAGMGLVSGEEEGEVATDFRGGRRRGMLGNSL